MLKVYINEEEVVANQNFTIQKHMLNTPSVILNNLCPKTWCENRDYSSFYHPLDYSKCKIQDEIYYPDLPGTTVSSTNASLTITDADTTKLCELTNIQGNTTQSGTPTPTTPQPINVVSGRQDIEVCGKNLCKSIYNTNLTNRYNRPLYTKITFEPNTIYTISFNVDKSGTLFYTNENIFTTSAPFEVISGERKNLTLTTKSDLSNLSSNDYSANGYAIFKNYVALDSSATFSNIQIEKGNTPSQYEKYKGNTYEINLGKNLLVNNLEGLKANNTGGTWNENVYTQNGVSFTYNSDGSITATGQATSNTYFYISRTGGSYKYTTLTTGTYYSTSHETTGSNSTWKMQFNDGDTSKNIFGTGNNKEAVSTITETKNIAFYIIVYSGQNPNGATFYPMISKSQGTDYAPYKTPIELCKINDYKDRIFRLDGKNLLDTSTATSGKYYGASEILDSNNWYIQQVPVQPNTNYYLSGNNYNNTSARIVLLDENKNYISVVGDYKNTHSITTTSNTAYIGISIADYHSTADMNTIMLEKGNQASSYEPYGEKGTWYIEKNIGKVVLDGSESGWANDSSGKLTGLTISDIKNYSSASAVIEGYCNYYQPGSLSSSRTNTNEYSSYSGKLYLNNQGMTLQNFKTWLSTHNTSVYYVLATPTYTEITDSELIGQLNALRLLEGLNNISISSGDLPGEITIHYNYQIAHTDIDLLFCGVVKNSGKISLNPREPHYSSLQILDFKTFLSEGETLDYVIYQKTILEAIQQVIGTISEYGFVLGNVNILNPDDIIGAYSTKDKTAYDVFNYIADITQSRWTTRMINENQVAIDFYDPTLMPEGTAIDYTDTFFNNNLIDDIKYSYGTNNYRNKQVMTSNQVYSNISQTQTIVANGYQTQFSVEQPIGKIKSITSNNIPLTFATYSEKEMGYVADFYYTPGENYFDSKDLRTTGEVLVIEYVAIIEGRQVITNSTEIERINESTGRKGIVARYENRNDATTSLELQKIGESYIKYKGTPEIILTIQSRKNTWEVGQRVQFNAPIDELDTEYMVRSKKINYITSTETLFYTYELVSSFNSETEINYFDNQRAKATGNIGEGEYISRNIDIESTANIIFYDTTTTETTLDGDNELNAILNSPIVS